MRDEKRLAQRGDSGRERISHGVAEIGLDILGEFLPDSFSLVGLLIVAAVFLFGLLVWAIKFLQD